MMVSLKLRPKAMIMNIKQIGNVLHTKDILEDGSNSIK